METHVCLALASRLSTNDNSDGLPGGLALRTCNSIYNRLQRGCYYADGALETFISSTLR